MSRRFSFASVILSYFLVGGGMFTATLIAGELHLTSELGGYALIAIGAFIGGFIAARASRGSTIIEPTIGALAVIGTIVGLAATTHIGQLVWIMAKDQTMKFVASVGVSAAIGALVGAALSEKLFGESTRSSLPWLLYSALASLGASLLATLIASFLFMTDKTGQLDQGELVLLGLAAGCLLAGLAIGASARTRPLIAALLGGGLGVAGFCLLLLQATPKDNNDISATIALSVGGALVTLIGTAIGWAAFGRRQEAAQAPAAGRNLAR